MSVFFAINGIMPSSISRREFDTRASYSFIPSSWLARILRPFVGHFLLNCRFIGHFLGCRFEELVDILLQMFAMQFRHALDEDINATFMNNDKAQEFVITVWRGESNQVEVESNQAGNQVEQKSNEVEEESNEVEDHDTGLRHSDTDLDTGLRHSDTDLDTGLRHSDTDLDTKRVTLTNKEKDIVNFCSVPRTTKEILDRIGVSMHSKNRERYITSLVAAGYLQMTNPDNPTASNQKYKKVNIR